MYRYIHDGGAPRYKSKLQIMRQKLVVMVLELEVILVVISKQPGKTAPSIDVPGGHFGVLSFLQH